MNDAKNEAKEEKSRLRRKLVLTLFFIMLASEAFTVMLSLTLLHLDVKPLVLMRPFPFALTALGFSLVVSSCVMGFISRRLIRPINNLILATSKIGKGDFSVRLDERQTNLKEMKRLIHSFNVMAGELGSLEMFRSDFINSFSHEFKTPIVSIRGFARQLARTEGLTAEQRAEYIAIIESEADRLATMSGNVLLLSRLEHTELVTDRRTFSLSEQLRKCLLLQERAWDEKQIEPDIDIDEVTYFGNEELTAHIWTNLISNAIKFTPSGGRIGISCHEAAGRIEVVVSDTGCGMTPEVQKRIFEKFYQGDKSHTGRGNGLGLSLVKRAVELSGGEISVESEPGAGSRFTVVL